MACMLAVAARDDKELFLILHVKWSVRGEIYVIPRINWQPHPSLGPRGPKWNPHASYKVSGDLFIKSFDEKMVRMRVQPLDASFRGAQSVWPVPVARNEPRSTGIECDASEFSDVFEIPVGELRPEKYRTYVDVQVVEPGGEPQFTPDTKVLRQKVLKDAIPWIAVTLIDTTWGVDLGTAP